MASFLLPTPEVLDSKVVSSHNSWVMANHLIMLSAFLTGSDSGAMHGLAGDVEQSGIGGQLLGKGFPLVAIPGDTAIGSGDAKEASKRDSKKKQVLNSKDKDKQTSTVSARNCNWFQSLHLDHQVCLMAVFLLYF
jgi:hypothetical protein